LRVRAFIADATFAGLPGDVTITAGVATLPVVEDLAAAWATWSRMLTSSCTARGATASTG
jgi:hypothetical protein